MINKELIEYIRSLKNKGIEDEKIKEQLLKYNYSSELVKKCFDELNKEYKKKEDKKKISFIPIIITSLLFFILVLIVIFFLIKANSLSYKQDCENVSIKIFETKGNEVICVFPDNSKIQLILENNGNKKIDKIDVFLNNYNIETLDLNLIQDQVFTKVIENEKKEKINTIKIIPYSNNKKCKALIKDNIKNC